MTRIQHTIFYEEFPDSSFLNDAQQQLLKEAQEECQYAYAPYSNYKVGAALLLENQQVIKGTNQENASYPCGICAERTALFSYGQGKNRNAILKIAISVSTENIILNYPPSPCGLCRQVLVEFEENNQRAIEIILGQPGRKCLVLYSAKDLLPFHFGSSNLK